MFVIIDELGRSIGRYDSREEVRRELEEILRDEGSLPVIVAVYGPDGKRIDFAESYFSAP